MVYSIKHTQLSSAFDSGSVLIPLPDSEIKIFNTNFVSEPSSKDLFTENDLSITENFEFSYPVFMPAEISDKVILLLHGLNERSWNKYLTWAYYLAMSTGSYVVLFPISFHINRAPVSWKDPRSLQKYYREQNATRGKIRSSTFANIALSCRLSEDPGRFVKSGYQTANDIKVLINQIKTGQHPVIPAVNTINIFSYSIGAFLSQIMIMSDNEGIFNDSKLFLFCGGSVFNNMQGESRHIMDKLAYDKLYDYYENLFENDIRKSNPLLKKIASSNLGLAFRSMISLNRFRDVREKTLKKLKDRIYAIALARDKVIPPTGIIETLGYGIRLEVIDFPFNYTHENPFPQLQENDIHKVDKSFNSLMYKAARFLE